MQVNNSSTFAFQTQQKRRRLEEEKKIENCGGSHSPPTVTSTDFCNFLNGGESSIDSNAQVYNGLLWKRPA